ncbi:J domain-containing protein [Aliterella atlantica]|uniref:J domain-containing protein n=1 Tax=Aliterella atlantica CENA595 TaxID=1618023 RepID=A0A0D8ZQZ0_9CYAN|nr:J domain-containing protein [Aliterella atlantica]KJH69641.1 hypothetical protein UH38_22690 [Aliterella atlantica CENA595]
MAWHNRYIDSIANSGLRITIEFKRQDLLWVSPKPIAHPRTGEDIFLPLRLTEKVAVSPNVLDIVKREPAIVEEEVEEIAANGSKQKIKRSVEKLVWRLRQPHEFFPQKPEEYAEEHPFSKSLCTGGTVVSEDKEFIAVKKRSTVSINSLVYRLAVGMTGSETEATRYIGRIAADAWEGDNDRAVKLYKLICQAKIGYVLDEKVPPQLKASASIGQIVESVVLRTACLWMGIDPNKPLKRQRGRPRTRSQDEDGNATRAGEVIQLTLQPDETVTGKLIADFLGLPKETNLAILTLSKLAEILVMLCDRELTTDAELLEAYLEAVDPDWRTKVAAEIGLEDNNEEKTNPWIILGLTSDASLEKVKAAYRKIMRQVHPDTSGLPTWYAQTVNDAYRQLLEELGDA